MVRKKRAVQDKYYKLAKEQGYRARSSFKLVQLNRKYDLLGKAKRVIDLCAAPGGWLQVCVKTMPKTPETQIIGVDLMPIKPIRGCVTFQADITSDHCRQLIRKEMKGNKAEVVLCDGAPNVGAEYSKDAFVQNELTVHALRFACEHLVKGGTFITKVFRSQDYNSLMWSFQQLFKKVEATKPASSRNVSAEIFVVCRNFLAPHKVDPRLLDPKHVLEQVVPDKKMSETSAVGLLFKKQGKKEKPNREGYDTSLGQGMYKENSAYDFITTSEPIQMLATSNSIHFKDAASKSLLDNPLTTPEIKNCFEDLKVLGNAELRLLIRWRSEVRSKFQKEKEEAEENKKKKDGEESSEKEEGSSSEDDEEKDGSDDDDEAVMGDLDAQLDKLKAEELQKKKREMKKKRKAHQQLQKRIDLGMENQYAIDLSQEQGPFSLSEIGVKSLSMLGDLQESIAVNISEVLRDEEEEVQPTQERVPVGGDQTAYLKQLEEEMEETYIRRIAAAKKADPLSVQQRRQLISEEKKAKMKKKTLESLAEADFTKALEEEQHRALSHGAYETLLRDDDEMSEGDDDEEDPIEMAKGQADKRTDRWFKQKLFEGVDLDEAEDEDESEDDLEGDAVAEDSDSDEDEDVVMPLPNARTEKAKRHEKRMKLKRRNERKEEKRRLAAAKEAKELNPDAEFVGLAHGFEMVPNEHGESTLVGKRPREDEEAYEGELEMEEPVTEKPAWAKDLIRKGVGRLANSRENDKIEFVPAETQKDIGDSSDSDDDVDEEEEAYNSEDYDLEERAQHLALGSLLTKKSKRRKILDAAYNRYTFNDDSLPDWFVEDENQHNRPIIPITKEMVDAVKARYKDLASRPINKVAEAKARKKRRLMTKVEKVKKQAAALVDQPDMTAGSKMRAIEKLYKGAKIDRPGSVYVVARKGQKGKVNTGGKKNKGKMVKIVDRRLKKDMRNQDRKDKKAKKGGRRRK